MDMFKETYGTVKSDTDYKITKLH